MTEITRYVATQAATEAPGTDTVAALEVRLLSAA